ncbi:MAG: hypothetical protein AAGJ18_28930 [Bacteroidota bacterium]
MTETTFSTFQDFFQKIQLTKNMANRGIFILDINDISETTLEEFSL